MDINELNYEITKRLEPAANIMVEKGLISTLEKVPRFLIDENNTIRIDNNEEEDYFVAYIIKNGDITVTIYYKDHPFFFSFNRYYTLAEKTADLNLIAFFEFDDFETISYIKEDGFKDHVEEVVDVAKSYIEEQVQMVIDKASKYLWKN